ncbi:MAG: flagellar biosynthetic protein FliR [Nitrospinota bacterium]
MNLFALPYDQFQQFVTVFFRTLGILGAAPFFGSRNVPVRAKAGLGVLVAVIIYPLVDFSGVVFPEKPGLLGFLIAGEVLIGMVIGYATRLFFTAIQVAGHLIGFQVGFAIVNVIDPQTSSQVSVISQFENIITTLFFLSTGAYFLFIQGMAESFAVIPPFGISFSREIVELVVSLFSDIFIIAIKISAPVLAASLFTTVALGLVARTVPQINIFIVGMPIQIALGLFMIGATLSFMSMVAENIFDQMEFTFYAMLRALG